MAKPDDTGKGTDQRGFTYTVDYVSEWFRKLKVTRRDPSKGSKTTVTVVENPRKRRKKKSKPARATTKVRSNEGIDFTLDIKGTVKQVRVDCVIPAKPGKDGDGEGEVVTLTVEDDQPPPEGPGGP